MRLSGRTGSSCVQGLGEDLQPWKEGMGREGKGGEGRGKEGKREEARKNEPKNLRVCTVFSLFLAPEWSVILYFTFLITDFMILLDIFIWLFSNFSVKLSSCILSCRYPVKTTFVL